MHAASGCDDLDLTSGRQERDFTYVKMRLKASCVWVNFCCSGNVINLATGRLYSVRHFVTEAARILNIKTDRLHFGVLPT